MRFKTDGSLDATFRGDGVVTQDLGGEETLSGLAIQPDGKIVAAGGGSSNGFEIVRFRQGTNEHAFYNYYANYNVTAALDRYDNVVDLFSTPPHTLHHPSTS